MPPDAIIHESVQDTDSFPLWGDHPIEPWLPYKGPLSYSASPWSSPVWWPGDGLRMEARPGSVRRFASSSAA